MTQKKYSMNLQDMKLFNKALVLEKLWQNTGLSRSELAEATGLSPASITAISEDLLKEGLIVEEGVGESTGGRKPVFLTVNPYGRYLCTVSIREKDVIYSLLNFKVEIVSEFTIPNSEEIIFQHLFDNLVANINQLLDACPEAGHKLIGIGISIADNYADLDQKVLFDTKVSVDRVNLDVALSYLYKIPVYLEKELNARAIVEYYFGTVKNCSKYVYIDVGHNVRAAIVVNGDLVKSPILSPDDMGHMIIDRDGPRCTCGRRGCLQIFSSVSAIIRRVVAGLMENQSALLRAKVGDNAQKINFSIIAECADQGDAFVQEVLDDAADNLCIGILNFSAMFNINSFVIGGLIRKPAYFNQSIRKGVRKHNIREEGIEVMVTSLPDAAVGLGNGVIGLKNFLQRGAG